MRIARLTLTFVLAVVLSVAGTSAAQAVTTDPAMQSRVDAVIDQFGGTQTGWNAVAWDDGAVVLELAPESAGTDSVTAAADNCASARYCAYASANYQGNKLTYSACPATYTNFSALLASPRSVKNDLSSGTVRVYGGSTVKATLSAGSGTSNVTGVTKITCS